MKIYIFLLTFLLVSGCSLNESGGTHPTLGRTFEEHLYPMTSYSEQCVDGKFRRYCTQFTHVTSP